MTDTSRGNRALCLYLLSRFPEALPELEQLYSNGDRNPGTLRLLVSTLHHLSEVDRAIEIAGQNEAAATEDGPAAGVYALAYLDAGMSAKAARHAQYALATNPDSIDGLTVRATLHAADLDTQAAETAYRRILELRPDNGRGWVGLGALSMLRQDFKQARDQLTQGLQHLPDHAGTWVTLGWSEVFLDDLAGAESSFRKALELDRSFAEVHGSLGCVAALQGRVSDARRFIEIALKLDSQTLSATVAQSILAGRAGDGKESRKLITQMLTNVKSQGSKRAGARMSLLTGL